MNVRILMRPIIATLLYIPEETHWRRLTSESQKPSPTKYFENTLKLSYQLLSINPSGVIGLIIIVLPLCMRN